MKSMLRRSLFSGALAPVLGGVVVLPVMAAPAARLWDKWAVNDPASQTVVDHQGWADFLRRFLVEEPDGINRVRYAEVAAGDRSSLVRYVDAMSRIAVSGLNRQEQFAYWINLYNALTAKTVIEHYPVDSIRDISLGGSLIPSFITGGSGPWGAKLLRIEGEDVGLDDIEHRILRPLMHDNRVHYAVNCASIGCPNLASVPFTAKRLPEMLDRGAQLFVNHPRGVRRESGGLTVSSIYHWYQEDFRGSWEGVLAHLRRYADSETQRLLTGFKSVASDTYDWRLNDAGSYSRTAQAPLRS